MASSSSQEGASSPQPTTACKIMNTYVCHDIFNRTDTCIVTNQNCVSYRNFGMCADVIEKYPYGDVAGLRKRDNLLRAYARVEDRDIEGECIIKSPPACVEGPTIATLISQFGIGCGFEDNNIAQRIAKKNYKCKDIVARLSRDTDERRTHCFNHAMFRLGFHMSSISREHIKNIIIPGGIGRSGHVDEIWLTKYLPTIHKFSLDMEQYGKKVYILMGHTITGILDCDFKDRDDHVALLYKTLREKCPIVDKDDFVGNDTENHDLSCFDDDFFFNSQGFY